MSKRLLRLASVGFTLVVSAGAGWLVGSLTGAPVAGLLCSAALGLAAVVLADSMKASRLLAWLRAGAAGHAPQDVGVWGEIAYQIEKVLRQRERATLQEQQRLTQFLAAVEASPIGVLMLDHDDRVAWCSRVAADHLGLDPTRDLAQPVTNLVRAPAFVERLVAPATGQAASFSGPNGNRLSVLVQPYGDSLKLLLTEDTTESERTELMRRNFVANVSHEIRTPLTVLAGFVETMSQLPLSEVERKRVLVLMTSQAQRMQALVADLLTLAQLEGSPRPAADRWWSVGALMRRVQADATAISSGRHELHFEGGDDAQLAGDESELHSALANLVTNAVRYTPPGGRIDVQWSRLDDGRGSWLVRDTGIGIEREHLPRLTERFYRVDGSRSRDTGGTGLGLSIVKHVVQRHGGEIDIQSEPGRGSSFRLLLPPPRVRLVAAHASLEHGVEAAQ
ncbi:MAG: phosphate regulon sensor histidine kinase PhoR [Rubrivivax sp.]